MKQSTFYDRLWNDPAIRYYYDTSVANLSYIKIAVLILALAVSFLIGRKKQDNSLQKSINKLNSTEYFKEQLNRDLLKTKHYLKLTSKMLKVVLVICIIYLLFLVASFSKILSPVLPSNVTLYFLLFFVLLFLLVWLVSKYLQRKEKTETSYLANIYTEEDKEVEKVLNEIGPKLRNRMKTTLQQQEKQNFEQNKRKECELPSCSQIKKLLRQAEVFLSSSINQMGNFRWCEVCIKTTAEKPIHRVDLKSLKIQGLGLDDMKRTFNKLLEIYQTKKSELNSACREQCSKGYCQYLRDIYQKYYQKVATYDSRLKQLKKI